MLYAVLHITLALLKQLWPSQVKLSENVSQCDLDH